MTRISAGLRFALLGAFAVLVCWTVQGPTIADETVNTPRPEKAAKKELLPILFIDFPTRTSFGTDDQYGQFVKKSLRFGWRVRANVDYGRVKKGTMGTYYGTNAGNPPCLVIWDPDLSSTSALLPNVPANKATHAYWVFWHQVEIVDIKH
jgi:hypothetical protein